MAKQKNNKSGLSAKKRFDSAFKDLKVANLNKQLDTGDNNINLNQANIVRLGNDNSSSTSYSCSIGIVFDTDPQQFNLENVRSLSFYLFVDFSDDIDSSNFAPNFDEWEGYGHQYSLVQADDPRYYFVTVDLPDGIVGDTRHDLANNLCKIYVDRELRSAPDQITVDVAGTEINQDRRLITDVVQYFCSQHHHAHVFHAVLSLDSQANTSKVILNDAIGGTRVCFWESQTVHDDSNENIGRVSKVNDKVIKRVKPPGVIKRPNSKTRLK